MSPGSSTESYPAFARIGLRENPGKNLNQVTCPDRDSNPGHLVSRPDALTAPYKVDLNNFEGKIVPGLGIEPEFQGSSVGRALVRLTKGSGPLRLAGLVACIVESRNAYRVLVVRPEGKRSLERPRRRWENNIKMDMRAVGYGGRDWINLAHNVFGNKLPLQRNAIIKARLLTFSFLISAKKNCDTYTMDVGTAVDSQLSSHSSRKREDRAEHFGTARGGEKRGGVLRQRDESARASGAGREERALDFSGVQSLETRRTFEATSLIRRPEFECSGPQLEGPEFECSGPRLEGPEFEYSELSLKIYGSRYCELEQACRDVAMHVGQMNHLEWGSRLAGCLTAMLCKSPISGLAWLPVWVESLPPR
ncbi:hypothetical protein ANN_12961 [Periplaneta americana]|uniref:Uncharacterized protein n=1 Tax=Periplaneta americana TaxID=6978 RepID=A0ABQ8TKL1_PERAM|nr:hypothetical protein ANN_12961 [Periplaneta americana]